VTFFLRHSVYIYRRPHTQLGLPLPYLTVIFWMGRANFQPCCFALFKATLCRNLPCYPCAQIFGISVGAFL